MDEPISNSPNMEPPLTRGPYAYENWRAFIAGGLFEGGFEYPLYSDAEFKPQADKFWGPYTLFNTLAGPSPYSTVRALFVLRTDLHLQPSSLVNADQKTTDVARFLGGGPELEIAALCSLAMGIRLKPGGMTRVFNKQPEYAHGLPLGGDVEGATRRSGGATTGVLPEVTKFKVLDVNRVATYPTLTPAQAVALARAAKQYQDGIWVAEGEGNVSWLFLVSAIETAADFWTAGKKFSPAELFRELRPDVAAILENAGGEQLLEKVAVHFASTLGATKKFVSFLLEFLPNPPPLRPPAHAQVDWSVKAIKGALQKVYHHRSKALHGGLPFPPVMCERPDQDQGWDVPAEKPFRGSYVNAYGVWGPEDTPMFLHTFEYIVRGALLKWWDSMTAAKTTTP